MTKTSISTKSLLKLMKTKGSKQEKVNAIVESIEKEKLFQESKSFYWDAKKYLERRCYDIALIQFEKYVLFANKKNEKIIPQVLLHKGYCHLQLGNYEAALNNLYQFIQLQTELQEINTNKDLAMAYKYKAKCYLKLDDIPKSVAAYNRSIELNGEDEDVRIELALIYRATGFNTAIKILSDGIIFKESSKLYHQRAKLYYEKNDLSKAVADYQRVLNLDAKNLEVQDELNEIYTLDAKVENYKKLIALNGIRMEYYNGNFHNVIALSNDFLRSQPGHALVLALSGIAYLMVKNSSKLAVLDLIMTARLRLDEAIKGGIKGAIIYNAFGTAYLEPPSLLDEAKKYFDMAIWEDIECADAFLNRARVYRLQNENELAQKDETTANKLNAELSSMHIYTQQIKVLDGQLRLDPANAHLYYQRGISALELGGAFFLTNKTEAINCLKDANKDFFEAIRYGGGSPSREIAISYFYQANYRDALAYFKKSSEFDDVAHLQLAICYVELVQYETAIENFAAGFELGLKDRYQIDDVLFKKAAIMQNHTATIAALENFSQKIDHYIQPGLERHYIYERAILAYKMATALSKNPDHNLDLITDFFISANETEAAVQVLSGLKIEPSLADEMDKSYTEIDELKLV